jgi:RimJ/RimL family protein N-acetyltransferase
MNPTISRVSVADGRLNPFLAAHWNELASNPRFAPQVSWDDFQALHCLPDTAQFILGAVVGDDLAGICTLTSYPNPAMAHRVQLGCGVLEQFRGHGLGRELLRAGISYAAGLQHLDYVDGSALACNERVLKLDLSVGFRVVATFEDFLRIDGEPIGLHQLIVDLRELRRVQPS